MRGQLAAFLLATLAAQYACTRDEIVSLEPEQAPGNSPTTLEVLLGPADLEAWVDSVFRGFSGAASAPFVRVEASADLASRGLVRFTNVSDTVFVVDTLSAALRLDSARVVFGVDSTLSQLPLGGGRIELRSVEESWDAASAMWELAIDTPGVTIPWSTPGGALGPLLDEVELTEMPDSIVFQLGQLSDSILRSWMDTTRANTGLAVVLADSGRLYLQLPVLRYLVVPEVAPDTSIELSTPTAGTERTFIFDPIADEPSAGVDRFGGVDGWRIYMQIVIPDSVPVEGFADPQPLRGALVSLAELILVSRGPPGPPLGAERGILGAAIELVDDFSLFGEKTPVGPLVDDSEFTVEPDSLGSGSEVRLKLTDLVQDWANTPVGSPAPPIRFGLRAVSESSTFGFWEFGAADGDPAFAPKLRILFTAPTEFPIP